MQFLEMFQRRDGGNIPAWRLSNQAVGSPSGGSTHWPVNGRRQVGRWNGCLEGSGAPAPCPRSTLASLEPDLQYSAPIPYLKVLSRTAYQERCIVRRLATFRLQLAHLEGQSAGHLAGIVATLAVAAVQYLVPSWHCTDVQARPVCGLQHEGCDSVMPDSR